MAKDEDTDDKEGGGDPRKRPQMSSRCISLLSTPKQRDDIIREGLCVAETAEGFIYMLTGH